jgi:hypothetical protein
MDEVIANSQGVLTGNGNSQFNVFSPESIALWAAVAIYSKAFLETLGKRTGDGLADLMQTRIRHRKEKITEAEVGLKTDAAATVVVTQNLPDEARLALLDLDVIADEVRGKTLRWNEKAMAWRPDSTDD